MKCQIDKSSLDARCFRSRDSAQKDTTKINADTAVTAESVYAVETAFAGEFAERRKKIWTRGFPKS